MFSVAQLLLPISATRICGEDLSFSSEVDEIARARIHDDPTLDQGEWIVALKEADWGFVSARCAKLIEARSKDMRLTVWLAEAQAKTRGLRGLGDGYAVLAGLCEHYWAGLHPVADDGDHEQRIGNLCWLLARTPALVQEAFPASLEDAQYCLAMLGELERVVDLQLGSDGPGFSTARETLQSTIYELVPPGGELVQAGEAGGGAGPNGAAVAAAGPASIPGPIQNRAQALAQLRLVADFFRRTEPHSPVAYLADKAASWGDMPLHIWLRAVIKDPATIAGMEELLDSSAGKG